MLLLVGRLGRPHGVRGLITVEPTTDEPEQRFAVGSSLLTEPAAHGPITVTHMRRHGDRLLLGIQGVADRKSAEQLRAVKVLVDSDQIPPPTDPETFADHQLIGLRVELETGDFLGEVLAMNHGAAGDQLVIAYRGREVLVPFVLAIVPVVDVAGGAIVIDPPEGLLEL
ncbi:MAG: ribosome maturation factor RimM [Acidimicrobiales bacterium]|nr:MAG: ribosome maturation factor RimM [Acidimicrobiales bacterium]